MGPKWLDLPSCLWECSIITHLDVVDRCHLALTCSDMRQRVRSVRPNHSLPPYVAAPFLVSIRNNGKTCNLLDPIHNEEYIVNTAGFLSPETRILCSKEGWLLLLAPETSAIFFFNPFTKARMDLPSNPDLHGYSFSSSAAPTSPDYFVLAILGFVGARVMISICRRGDEEWENLWSFDNAVPFLVSHACPVFYGGLFYCLGEGGALGLFDPQEESWTTISASPGRPTDGQFSLVESNGALLRVFVDHRRRQIEVCKLNSSTHQWTKIQSLGDATLFVGGRTSISVGGAPSRTSTHDRIYFQRLQAGKCAFYCNKEGIFHPEETFYGSEEYPRSSWMKANLWVEEPNK